MTGFNNNNEFKPNIPKTFQVLELRDQYQEQQRPVKKSPLSVAARNKVVNRSGSNYLSEKEGYGPCTHGCDKCSITAILIDTDGHSRSETLFRPVFFGEGGVVPWKGQIEESGWGPWKSCYYIGVEEISKIQDQCGHKTVCVTDKKEWK